MSVSPQPLIIQGEVKYSQTDPLFLSTFLTLLTGHALAKYYGLDLFKNAGVTAATALLWALFVFSITYSDSLPSRVIGDGMWATIDKLAFNGSNNNNPKAYSIYGANPFNAYVGYSSMYPFVASTFSLAALSLSILLTATTKMNYLTCIFFSAIWLVASYVPLTHWMKTFASDNKYAGWMGQTGFGVLDSAGTHNIHMNAGVAFLVLSFWMGELRAKTVIIPDYDNFFWLKLAFTGYIVGGNFLPGGQAPAPYTLTPSTLDVSGSVIQYGAKFAPIELGPKLINTIMASSTGFLTMVFIDVIFNHGQGLFRGKPSAMNATTGALAGLIAVSCGAGHISPMWASFFGFYTALSVYVTPFILGFAGIDQGYSPFVLHFVGGAVGSALTGLFANSQYSGAVYTQGGDTYYTLFSSTKGYEAAPTAGIPNTTKYNGSFYGNSIQLGKQCAGISVVFLVSAVATTAAYWFVYAVERLVLFPHIVSLKEGEEGDENLAKM